MTQPLLIIAFAVIGAGLFLTRRWGHSPWRWLVWPQVGLALLATWLAYHRQIPPSLVSLPFTDKFFHVLLVGAAAFWLNLWLGGRRWRLNVPLAIALLLALVTVDELLQGLSPARSFDVFDWVCNVAGLALAWRLSEWLPQPGPQSKPRGERAEPARTELT
jgi:hypothetical protein